MNYTNDTVIDNLREFLKDLVGYWYVLLISLFITLGGAMFYIKVAAPTYKVYASVLLNTERTSAYGANPGDMMRVNEMRWKTARMFICGTSVRFWPGYEVRRREEDGRPGSVSSVRSG